MFQITAIDIWKKETESVSIITLNKTLDRHLGNGIKGGIITEFCGKSGTGKTQICLQLCITVQFDGNNQKAIFVDTNQGFNIERLREMASYCIQKFTLLNMFTTDHYLENVYYTYCKDYIELIASIEMIKEKVKNDPQIKLIVIDSFSFLIRSYELDSSERVYLSCRLLNDLQILADKYDVAVVITNELTTRIFENDEAVICAALGDSHFHKIAQRILLSKDNFGKRFAYLEKTLNAPNIYIPFEINEFGFRSHT